MKKVIILLFVFGLFLPLSTCLDNWYSRDLGTVNNAEVNCGSSILYSEAEIESAFEVVITHFRSSFGGCDLRRLWYDEERSDNFILAYKSFTDEDTIEISKLPHESGNTIVILSDVYIYAVGGHEAFSPDSTYTDWYWVLTRNSENESWSILLYSMGSKS